MSTPTTSPSAATALDDLLVWPEPMVLHAPNGSIEGYEERQAMLNRLSRRWAELNPHLKPFDPTKPKVRGVTLAAKNARILLKRAYPNLTVRVTSEKYSTGSSLTMEWTAFSPEPSTSSVRERLNLFATGHFDGSTDNYEYDNDLLREAFRKTFGSATSVHTQTFQPSPQERAAHEQAVLRATLDDEPANAGPAPRTGRRL